MTIIVPWLKPIGVRGTVESIPASRGQHIDQDAVVTPEYLFHENESWPTPTMEVIDHIGSWGSTNFNLVD